METLLARFAEGLDSPDASVRIQSYRQVAIQPDAESMGLIAGALAKETDPAVRSAVAQLLGGLPDTTALNPLARLAKDPDPGVRIAAVQSLHRRSEKDASAILVAMIFDPDEQVSRKAEQACAAMGKERMVALLGEMVQSDRAWMFKAAVRAAGRFNTRQMVPILEVAWNRAEPPDRDKVLQSIRSLAERQNPAAQELLDRLSSAGGSPTPRAAPAAETPASTGGPAPTLARKAPPAGPAPASGPAAPPPPPKPARSAFASEDAMAARLPATVVPGALPGPDMGATAVPGNPPPARPARPARPGKGGLRRDEKEPMRACPVCAEMIPRNATRCELCGEMLVATAPTSFKAGVENLAAEPVADWRLRGGSYVLDSLLGTLLSIIPFGGIIYHFVKDALGSGRSPGKRFNSLVVVDATTGAPCSFGQSCARNLMLFIPVINLVELFLIISSGIRLGDRLAGTRVVRPRSAPPPSMGVNYFLMFGLTFIPIFIIGVLAAIAIPNFTNARVKANVRACYANQKTIAGASEMYALDKNVKEAIEVNPAFLAELQREGYLQSIPQDPGQGENSASNYYSVPDGNGIACRVHGDVRGTRPGTATKPGR